MKDNIEQKLINNRKIIIELRFTALPKILDIKGTLIDKISKLDLFPVTDWGIGDSAFKLSDNPNEDEIRNIIRVEINRLSYISSSISSIEKLYNDFSKLYDCFKNEVSDIDITRIGCRIQGTYEAKSTKYSDILDKFKTSFPNQSFIKDFPINDMRLQMVYQNGSYNIGPVNKNDTFLKKEFRYSSRNNSIGFAVDTDNYLLKTNGENLNNISNVKNVMIATLAVEKSLVENLKDF